MTSNPNAFAAALTAVFVWILSRVVEHFQLVDVTPGRILLAAGGLTALILWIGRAGLRGALLRLWDGANNAVNGHPDTRPASPSKPKSS
jgi:hypothetical protein